MSNNVFADRLSPTETAEILGVTEGTLAVWRCTSRYPLPWVKVGRKVFYRQRDISKFISENLHESIQREAKTVRGGER
ncbi:MAG: helix-turn-helix domain-containing protein [Pseudomonadota bacterium]